ncbi:MAG: NAD(P)H-binding protein [Piscinibacter sp.]|nr:NAD(P)H-binding protein [Piscinibacter sp.]
MARPKSTSRRVLLAGASGLVGRELLRLLLEDKRNAAVHLLLRRALPGLPRDDRLVVHDGVDFASLPKLPTLDDAVIALGTTIKVAGSQAAFRAVDFDAVVNTARAARAAGARRAAIVSALGADAKSAVFYNRVKGEMQDAVSAAGFDTVVFAQPSLLVGDRATLGQPTRPVEVWAARLLAPVMGLVPASVRPIEAATVARALLRAMDELAPGVHCLPSARLQQLGAPSH